ncbi:hypothetical protein [Providencia hangzhouensis]
MRFELIISYLIKFTVNCLMLLISINSYADNRPDFVCGQFNGTVIEVPDKYAFPFAEYEGYSYFDPRFIENKEGCDANFRELTLITHWPYMTSVDPQKKFHLEIDEKTIRIILRPIREKDYSLTQKMKNYLNASYLGKRSQIFYDDDSELQYVDYFDEYNVSEKLYSGKRTQKKRTFFWFENENEVIAILECLWLPLENKYSSCNMIFSISEIGILAEIKFSFDKYNQWRDIMNEAKVFVSVLLRMNIMSKDMASFSINYNDVVNLKAILNEGGLEEFYRYLADKGDRYSLAAPGSYNEHSFLSRLYFHYGLDVYSDELKYMYLREKLYRVQQDLAKEYMVLIESKFKNNMDKRGVVNISSEDIYKHYMNVLEKNNMFMGYWDTNIAMLFFTTEERGEYWDSKLNNSDSFKGQVIHYFKTINFLLDIYDKFTDKKGTPIAWYLKNNYDLFMYERGYELIEEQKDIILKDKDLVI